MEIVNRGRKLVIGIIVVVLLVDILTIASVSSIYAVNGRADLASYKLLQGIFRFILTALLLTFLYKGRNWAKWLTVVLFILGGLVSLLSLMSTFSLILLAMGVLYVVIALMLITSKSINQFFQYQMGFYHPL